MSASCHANSTFDGASRSYKRALWAVVFINLTLFGVEMWGSQHAQSKALQADALDFLGDSLTYGMSLLVIGKALKVRASVALVKGLSLCAMGGWVLWSTAQSLFLGVVPEPQTMSLIAVLALLANVASVLILMRFRDGDSNVRSVWLCSRNDAIGNVAVLAAAGVVTLTQSHYPDVIVALFMACLFLWSAVGILHQSALELKTGHVGGDLAHAQTTCRKIRED